MAAFQSKALDVFGSCLRFHSFGMPGSSDCPRCVFNGDFVDRGRPGRWEKNGNNKCGRVKEVKVKLEIGKWM